MLFCLLLSFQIFTGRVDSLVTKSVLEGIPNTYCTSIFQDTNDFLWFGSFNNVARYNGYSRHIFKSNPQANKPIFKDRIFEIYQYQDKIWFVSESAYLYSIDLLTDSIAAFHLPEQFGNNFITANEQNAGIWLGTEKALIFFDFISQNFLEKYKGHVAAIVPLPEEKLFLQIYNNQFVEYKITDQTAKHLDLNFKSANQPFFYNNQIVLQYPNSIDFYTTEYRFTRRIPLPFNGTITNFFFYNEQFGIIGTNNSGAYIFDNNEFTISALDDEDLRQASIHDIFIDKSQNIWFALANNGAAKIKKLIKPYNLLFELKNKNDIILTIEQDSQNRIWFGTNKSGLFVLDENQQQLELPIIKQVSSSFIPAIVTSNDSVIWIATLGNGLVRYNTINEETEFFRYNQIDTNTISNNLVFSLEIESVDTIWVGTYSGLNRIIRDSHNHYYAERFSGDGILKGAQINKLSYKNKRLWVATNSGLKIINTENNSVHASKADFFETISIRNILANEFQNCWIATNDGLFLIDSTFIILKRFNSKTNFPSDLLTDIVHIAENKLLIGSNDGLIQFDIKNETFNNYRDKNLFDHINTITSFDNNAIVSSQSRLYLFKNTFSNNNRAPKIQFTNLKVFDLEIPLKRSLTAINSIELEHFNNNITIEFAALDFTDPGRNNYRYKMSDIDPNWIYSGNQNRAIYSYLEPGNYIFSVIGSNSDGIWSPIERKLLIKIKPPFYRTSLAYMIYLILVLAICYEIYQRIVERARQQAKQEEIRLNNELEKQRMKSQIATDLHDEIGSNLSSIKLISERLAKNNQLTHTEMKQLSVIHDISASSANAIREIVWFINPANETMSAFMNKIQQTAQIMLDGFVLNIEIDEKIHSIETSIEQRRNIFLFFKEALQNIIKHSKCDLVDIKFLLIENTLKIAISDNGKGFDLNTDLLGNGLNNFKKRADNINAKFNIKSAIGNGTEIRLELKIP